MLSIEDLVTPIPIEEIGRLEKSQYRQVLRAKASVPASTVQTTNLQISGDGAFLCMFVTGRFTTLDAGPADNGLCKLQLQMSIPGKVYIPDPIDMDMLLSPGRVKDPSVAGAAASNALFYPWDFQALWRPLTTISFQVTNSAAIANTWELALHGVRVLG